MGQSWRPRLPGAGARPIHAVPHRDETGQGGPRRGRTEPGSNAITSTRLAVRRSLLGQLDGFRRAFDHDDAVRGSTASLSEPSKFWLRERSMMRSTSPRKINESVPGMASGI